jgi:hypothetical protein
MSKVILKYEYTSSNPDLPFGDIPEWTGDDAIVSEQFRKQVLQPLAYLYMGYTHYSNNSIRAARYSFANTEMAMEYHTRRRQANAAIYAAVEAIRQRKISNGESAPLSPRFILVDENGNETILT